MSKTKKFILFAICAGAVLFGWIIYSGEPQGGNKTEINSRSSQAELSEEVFSNAKYGYSFRYPSNMSIDKKSDESIWVGERNGNKFRAIFTVNLIKNSSDSQIATYEEFVLDAARIMCAEKSLDGAGACVEIIDLKGFSSKEGDEGESFYIGGAGKKMHGPFYAFNTSMATDDVMSVVIFGVPFSYSTSEFERNLLEKAAFSYEQK